MHILKRRKKYYSYYKTIIFFFFYLIYLLSVNLFYFTEQSFNTNIQCELFFKELKLEKGIFNNEGDEEEIIISTDDIKKDLIIDDCDNIDSIFYTECHFFDIDTDEDIGYLLYVYPATKDEHMNITSFYQKPFYTNYFIDSIERFEELCIVGDAIKNAVLDVTNNQEGKITIFDYEKILKRAEKNRQLLMKRLN